jgi:hypothetical protein
MPANRFLSVVLAIAFLFMSPCGLRAADPAGPAIDVSLVTPSDCMAFVAHPRRIAESPIVAELLKDPTVADAIQKSGIDPREVEQLVSLVGLKARQAGPPEPYFVTILHFTHDVDAKTLLTGIAAASGQNSPEFIKEIKVAGKDCFELGRSDDAPLVYSPNKRTIVFTSKNHIRQVVSGAEPEGPLLDRLKKADAGHCVIIAIAPKAIPDLDVIFDSIKRSAPPLVGNYLDAARTVNGGTASFNLNAPTMLHVVLDTDDVHAAGKLEDLLQQTLRMASGGLMIAKHTIPKEMKAKLDPLVEFGDQFIDGGKAIRSGSQVTLDFTRPKMLDTGSATLVGALRKAVLHKAAK